MKRQDAQRTGSEIILPDGRRVSTVYKADYPGGQGPALVTPRSVWWGTYSCTIIVQCPLNDRI